MRVGIVHAGGSPGRRDSHRKLLGHPGHGVRPPAHRSESQIWVLVLGEGSGIHAAQPGLHQAQQFQVSGPLVFHQELLELVQRVVDSHHGVGGEAHRNNAAKARLQRIFAEIGLVELLARGVVEELLSLQVSILDGSNPDPQENGLRRRLDECTCAEREGTTPGMPSRRAMRQ